MCGKRVLISGYYGFQNTGDDGVLSSVIAGLRSAMDDEPTISVLSAVPEETSAVHDVEAIPRMSVSAVRKAVRDCDLLISGGGSLIQDATSLQSAIYYIAIILQAKMFRRKVMVLGQGIGPLRSGISRFLTAKALSGIDAITVRDAESGDLLRSLGVERPPVVVTADPTFLLHPSPKETVDELLSEVGIGRDEEVIAVAFRDWPETPRICDALVESLKIMQKRIPARLMLLTMHTPEDAVTARRIADEVGGLAVQPRRWSPEEMLGVVARSRLAVSMRLHTLIFAASSGVPSVGISYDPKVRSFQSSVGQDCLTLDEAIAGALPDRVLAAWEGRSSLACALNENVPKMRDAAAENIRRAVELLR
jgi:polysaccharide pyruvyl transferase CsaB